MFMDESEKKYFSLITNNMNRLIESVYSYLNFISSDSEKMEYSFSLSRSKSFISIESNDNETEQEIQRLAHSFFITLQGEMKYLNDEMEEFGKYYDKNTNNNLSYRNINEIITLYNNYEKMTMKNILFKEKTQKNELIYLIFKQIVNMCQFSIVGETLKSEIKNNYIIRKKNNNKPGNGNLQSFIKTKIDDYIRNVLKNHIEFNYDIKGIITIKYLPFLIYIVLPMKDNYLSLSLKHKISISINFINGKKEVQSLLLIEKLKILIDNRISAIFNLISDEKKVTIQKSITLSEQNLLDFLMNLLNYLNNFNNIFTRKCASCGHISKYSYIEKCFFPPYYKLYKTNKFGINENENLFYHEDCFRKISNPSL